ncbi:DUF4249 domain-containing protein [Chitinophaga vietnamensis]|uniref:DUF4249 domain-containing protein n=1 Tax=Chitinophaga vietnamensis TaxID=2593957 RepID=UPI00117869E3|nr:DUF4249 domain-containing protein [Chitinophaga vietnamensis]
MRVAILLCLVAIAFASCEKDVSVNLQQQNPQLVVEGKIENGKYPMVILTHSLSYFSKIDADKLLGSFVHNAIVTVSDGSQTITLKEQTIDTTFGAKVYIYGVDESQPGNAFKGKIGTSYTLKITADKKSYSAVTKIPTYGMKLDSVWWHRASVNKDTMKAHLYVRITDAPEFGNYARYFTKRNHEAFLPGLNSTMDDQIVNGTTFELPLDAGVDKNQSVNLETFSFFNRGDTVIVKFCNIDKGTWDFWRTVDFAYNSNGNPFSSPTTIIGNIPGALGYWGGYAATFDTVYIKK